MLLAGLTGGVGSGKSAVAGMLYEKGARIIDTDVLAREFTSLGSPVLSEVLAAFGPEVFEPDGSLNRAQLAEVVFGDDNKRAVLEGLLHPKIRKAAFDAIDQYQESNDVVVVVVPLLVESRGAYPVDIAIVVDCEPETVISRLIQNRGWTRQQAEARIGAQISREERNAAADVIISNSGSFEDLHSQVDRLWLDLSRR